MKAVFAPFPIGREQDLAVGFRRELVPFGPQFVPQLEVVVDLAVQDEVVAAGGVGHGLQPGLAEVDDCEPPVPERHRTSRRRELAPPRSVGPAPGRRRWMRRGRTWFGSAGSRVLDPYGTENRL